jgi:hypothetical protein
MTTSKSLDELAREQGVEPIDDLQQLRGEPIDDFDVFMQAIRVARGDG